MTCWCCTISAGTEHGTGTWRLRQRAPGSSSLAAPERAQSPQPCLGCRTAPSPASPEQGCRGCCVSPSSWTAREGSELCWLLSHQPRPRVQPLVCGLCKYTAGERCVAGLRVNPSAPHSQNCCPSSAATFCCLWPPLSLPRPSCAPWGTFVLRVTSLCVRVSCALRFPDFAHEGSARTPLCAPERLKGQSPCVGDTARLAALNPGTEHTSHTAGHSARSCTHTEPTPPAWKKSAFCWLEAPLGCEVSFFQPLFFSFS